MRRADSLEYERLKLIPSIPRLTVCEKVVYNMWVTLSRIEQDVANILRLR